MESIFGMERAQKKYNRKLEAELTASFLLHKAG